MPLADRWFRWICILMLALLAGTQAIVATGDSQTWDEGTHLAAGYSYWKTGDYRLNPDHPALGTLLHSLPLLLLDPILPTYHPSWAKVQDFEFGTRFLMYNRYTVDELLMAGRSVAILFSVLLGAALAWWLRKHFGAKAALFALAIYVLDPLVISIGHYITNDIVAAFFFFLTCALWTDYWLEGGRRRLWGAGFCFAAAITIKYSALILGPVLILLFFAFRFAAKKLALASLAKAMAVVVLCGFLMIGVAYAPEFVATVRVWNGAQPYGPYTTPVWDIGPFQRTAIGQEYIRLAREYRLPFYAYLRGFMNQMDYYGGGRQPLYLLGEISKEGWWYYFPVAIAVKSPVAVLVLLLLSAGIFFLRRRDIPARAFGVILPAAVFLGVSMGSGLNIGLRHLLPAIVLAQCGIAILFVKYPPRFLERRQAWVAAVLLLALAAESASAFPSYLSFFNVAAGGIGAGPKYILDSNIDWGQDGKRLAAYQEQQNLNLMCVAYFGSVNLWYYGMVWRELPKFETLRDSNCVAAVSVTLLHGLYVPPGAYQELRALQPIGRIGGSIYLYDLRKNASGQLTRR
jgi:hypothetical protein